METSSDKTWAKQYLLDPLTAPEPSEETGPGSHFRPPSAASNTSSTPSSTTKKLSKNPFRQSSQSSTKDDPIRSTSELRTKANIASTTRETIGETGKPNAYPSPPGSTTTSPRQPHSPNHRVEAFSPSSALPAGRRRGSSLTERFPGDISHRPLDMLAREKAIADRSRHMTKKHHVRPDTIDSLDVTSGSAYHHSGPFDATLYARNNSYLTSPVQAVAESNAETLKATPKEYIKDAVELHRPLDGVAAFPSGTRDRNGTLYEYEEGANMMTDFMPEGGAYRRWDDGVQYSPGDIKGKGEPAYSIEKALKDSQIDNSVLGHGHGARSHRREMSDGIEMTTTANRSASADGKDVDVQQPRRSNSLSHRLSGGGGGGLKKRMGSLRKKLGSHED